MIVTAWRIFKPKHAANAFTGLGARLFGGRFNSKGVAVVYAAGSVSLAALEMLVHLQSRKILMAYTVQSASFDASLVQTVRISDLPNNWRTSPSPVRLRRLGDAWIASGASAILKVPSVVVESESNFLLNSNHADFARIKLGKAKSFRFDRRLSKV